MPQLDQVLADVDKDLDNSLQRLFQWLRIPSISTDPAYAGHCRQAAGWLSEHLKALGFDSIYCGTSTANLLLQHSGWRAIDAVQLLGKDVSVYAKAL